MPSTFFGTSSPDCRSATARSNSDARYAELAPFSAARLPSSAAVRRPCGSCAAALLAGTPSLRPWARNAITTPWVRVLNNTILLYTRIGTRYIRETMDVLPRGRWLVSLFFGAALMPRHGTARHKIAVARPRFFVRLSTIDDEPPGREHPGARMICNDTSAQTYARVAKMESHS